MNSFFKKILDSKNNLSWSSILNIQLQEYSNLNSLNLLILAIEYIYSLNKPFYFKYINQKDNRITNIYGLITEIESDNIWIKDLNQKIKVFNCNKCNEIYWGKYRKNKRTLLQEGQQCEKTAGCDGVLIETVQYQPKELIISNIENIFDENNSEINFKEYFQKNIKEDKMNSNKTSTNKTTFISMAKFKNTNKKEYDEFKKRVWTPDNEATYDYWANLYGKGMTPEDTEQRQDFADAMVKNN